MGHEPSGRITLEADRARIRIIACGSALIADTRSAVKLTEIGYPVRYYIPRNDVAMDRMKPSGTVTYCPFKGDATYYSVALDGEAIADAAWSYEQPFLALQPIAGHLAFDALLVEVRRDPDGGAS